MCGWNSPCFLLIGFRHGCSQNTYSHNIFYYEHFGEGLLLYFWGPHRSVTLHYTQDIIHTSGTYQYKGLPLFSLEWFSLIKWLSVPEQNTDNKGKNKVLRVLYSHLRKPVEILWNWILFLRPCSKRLNQLDSGYIRKATSWFTILKLCVTIMQLKCQ